ncbi:MAG: glycosyltransferase [Ginsengibacter sp.]
MTTFLLISLALSLPYFVLIIYYFLSWLKLPYYTGHGKSLKNSTFITIIIAARNEEKNIGNCIQSIIAQSYPEDLFELIIIDDHSGDTTASRATSFIKDNLSVIKLQDFTGNENLNSYKKKAIELGIRQAKGTLIVTTDADCIVPAGWLQTIATFYEETNAVFIVAPVVYNDPVNSDPLFTKLFKIFQSLDFMMLQGITGASVFKKFHGMCNGANLVYEKQVFYEVGGFQGIDTIASGDDMFLMHKIQKIYPHRITYLKSPGVIVETQPAETLKDFMNQRIRWASKAGKYSDRKITAVLWLVYLYNAWIVFVGLYSFFYQNILYLLFLLLLLKTLVELFFLLPVAGFFKKQKLLWLFLPAQPFHIVYTLVAGWLGKFGAYTWKGRSVK